MNIKDYFNLYELLQHDKSTKEQRRAFGLTQVLLQNKPYAQLQAWVESRLSLLPKPTLYERYASYLYGVNLILFLFAFVLGLLSGMALLHYNGKAPVNVVYFMAMVIALPLLSMVLTLFSMLKAQQAHAMLIHLSPSYWMEKLVARLSQKWYAQMQRWQVSPLLAHWIVIQRAQVMALFFSLGLLAALLVMVVTQDIAFAWSTTLQVEPQAFHAFVESLSVPWRSWLVEAVPSLELVEKSQYYRLGERVSASLVEEVALLGGWWKFLAMATLFYAIFLRLLLYLLASYGLRRAARESLMRLEGVDLLLQEMNEPAISTQTQTKSQKKQTSLAGKLQTIKRLDGSYDVVQGWALEKERLLVLNDMLGIISPLVLEVGGSHSLLQDKEQIAKSHGEVLLYVKAWEPPTMDFVDYVEMLCKRVDKVVVVPTGMPQDSYTPQSVHAKVWADKLLGLRSAKIWFKMLHQEEVA